MNNYVAKHDKLMRHLGMTIEEASREYARVTMPIEEHNKNGMGLAHGGAIFALADVAERVGIRPPEIFSMAQALDRRAMCYTIDEFLSSFQEV